MVTLTLFLLQHNFVFTIFCDAFEKVCEIYVCTLTGGLGTYNSLTLLNLHMLHVDAIPIQIVISMPRH